MGKNYKPRIPDIFEAVFDIGYLLFDVIAGIIFFAKADGRSLFVLYGVLTFTPYSYPMHAGFTERTF